MGGNEGRQNPEIQPKVKSGDKVEVKNPNTVANLNPGDYQTGTVPKAGGDTTVAKLDHVTITDPAKVPAESGRILASAAGAVGYEGAGPGFSFNSEGFNKFSNERMNALAALRERAAGSNNQAELTAMLDQANAHGVVLSTAIAKLAQLTDQSTTLT
jgi:hypothetical protein